MRFSRCLFKRALKDLYEALCHIFSDMSTFSKVSITFKSRSIFKIINIKHSLLEIYISFHFLIQQGRHLCLKNLSIVYIGPYHSERPAEFIHNV